MSQGAEARKLDVATFVDMVGILAGDCAKLDRGCVVVLLPVDQVVSKAAGWSTIFGRRFTAQAETRPRMRKTTHQDLVLMLWLHG
jgi:hypothetical protein